MKAQGATEYLVLMSVVLGIALICVAILVWPTGSTKDVKNSQSDIKCGIAKNTVPDIMSGMVAYYKFDEGSGTLTYNRETGASSTLGGSWAIGKSGTADHFNTGQCTSASSISTTNGITVSIWVKPDSLSGATVGSPIRAGIQNGVNGFHWIYLYSTSITWQYADGTDYQAPGVNYALPVGNWSHIVVTHDYGARRLNFYVNNRLVSSQGTNAVLSLSGDQLVFGSYDTSCTVHLLNGTVDEALVYNRILSADEIKFLYEYPGCP